jgi:HSP20 family protein
MSTLARRESRPFMDILDWLEVPWTVVRPIAGHPMRVEDYLQDGRYVLRAELPGIDPESDLEVTADHGNLTIKAERKEQAAGKHRSEFRYGTFTRSVALPDGADAEHIQATYDSGILEIWISLKQQDEPKPHRIPVRRNQHIKPT